MSLKNPTPIVTKAREVSRNYYQGTYGLHYSCGIAVALTFGLDPKSYRSLRRGGILGCGECGALKAGEMVLGEFLGDPNPSGPVTASLQTAVAQYRKRLAELGYDPYGSCSDLTDGFGQFQSNERTSYCANLVEFVAIVVAELLEANRVNFCVTEP